VEIRIAVVDDELFFREAITDVLSAAGFACETAEDGAGALALAEDPAVGVMVLDVRMPGMDGIEVLSSLRDGRPDLQVLVLSASTDQETVLEALRLGAYDYLAKPLHDEELVLAVRRAASSFAISADSRHLRGRLARLVSITEDLSRNAGRMGAQRAEYLRTAAVEAAAELLEAQRTSLLLRDESDDLAGAAELRVVAAVGLPEAIAQLDVTREGVGVAGRVAATGDALLVESRSRDGRFDEPPVAGRYESESFVVVPLHRRSPMDGVPDLDPDSSGRFEESVFGVLCATNPVARPSFGADDLALLRLLAGRLAELLAEPADFKTPAANDATSGPLDSLTTPFLPVGGILDRDAELVREICDALVNEVEPERVLQAVLEPVERGLSAAPVSLYLLDGTTGELVCEAQVDGGVRADRKTLPASSGLTGTVLQSGNLIATQSPELDSRYDPAVDTPEDGSPGPLLCVPIRLRGKGVGLCRVFLPAAVTASPRTGEALAAALSAAVRNVLLYRSLIESIEEVAEARREARR